MSEIDDVDAEDTRAEEEEADFDGKVVAIPLVTGLGPGVYDMDLLSYLADPCDTPSLRSSDIQRMLRLRPSHVRVFHPRLVDTDEQRAWAIRKATKRMNLGTAIHRLVLDKGSEFCVIDPAQFMVKAKKKGDPPTPGKTLNTAEAKAAVAAARAKGLIVLDPKTNDVAERAAQRLRAKLSEEFAHLGGWPFGDAEKTLIWTEQTQYGPVMCRARPDILSVVHAIGGDVKTSAAGLSDEDVQHSMSANDGEMFVQAAWQRRGILANYPELADKLRQVHPFVETEPPYEPRVIWPSVDSLLTAEFRCIRAVEQFAFCMHNGEWPAWPPATVAAAPYTASRWAVQENAWSDEDLGTGAP